MTAAGIYDRAPNSGPCVLLAPNTLVSLTDFLLCAPQTELFWESEVKILSSPSVKLKSGCVDAF